MMLTPKLNIGNAIRQCLLEEVLEQHAYAYPACKRLANGTHYKQQALYLVTSTSTEQNGLAL